MLWPIKNIAAPSSSMATAPLSFAPLSATAIEELADARNFVASLAGRLADGRSLTQAEADLAVLQAIVNHGSMRHANFEAWVALGIAFGDALAASIPGLAWRLAADESGTYATLQFQSKAISVAAPTMLWKRIERGEQMDLVFMAQEIRQVIDEAALDSKDAEPNRACGAVDDGVNLRLFDGEDAHFS